MERRKNETIRIKLVSFLTGFALLKNIFLDFLHFCEFSHKGSQIYADYH